MGDLPYILARHRRCIYAPTLSPQGKQQQPTLEKIKELQLLRQQQGQQLLKQQQQQQLEAQKKEDQRPLPAYSKPHTFDEALGDFGSMETAAFSSHSADPSYEETPAAGRGAGAEEEGPALPPIKSLGTVDAVDW